MQRPLSVQRHPAARGAEDEERQLFDDAPHTSAPRGVARHAAIAAADRAARRRASSSTHGSVTSIGFAISPSANSADARAGTPARAGAAPSARRRAASAGRTSPRARPCAPRPRPRTRRAAGAAPRARRAPPIAQARAGESRRTARNSSTALAACSSRLVRWWPRGLRPKSSTSSMCDQEVSGCQLAGDGRASSAHADAVGRSGRAARSGCAVTYSLIVEADEAVVERRQEDRDGARERVASAATRQRRSARQVSDEAR